MTDNTLEHSDVTILELIIDNEEIEYQEVFSRVNDMMSLLGEPMSDEIFLNKMEKIIDLKFVTQVNSDPVKYRITETGKQKLFGDI